MGKSSDSNTSDSDEDRRERDKFSERLKKKDKEKTRNIVSRSGNEHFTIRDSVLYNLYRPSILAYKSFSIQVRPRLSNNNLIFGHDLYLV